MFVLGSHRHALSPDRISESPTRTLSYRDGVRTIVKPLSIYSHGYATMTTAIRTSTADCVGTTRTMRLKGRFAAPRPRLLLLMDEDWYFRCHRLDHARAARDAGMEVLVSTRAQDGGKWITEEGFKHLPIPYRRGSRQPLRELMAVVQLAQLYRREKPDIVHHVCMKPILYGSWAARLAGIPAVVNTFAGLGSVFTGTGRRSHLLRAGLTAGLRSALALPNSRALFENPTDRDRLVRAKVVRREDTVMISGTGVDITKFIPMPEHEGIPVVVLSCRMLWEKGVGDFVHAARLLKEQGVRGRCVLVGTSDPDNPSSIPESQLLVWQQERVVEWWGYREDMPNVLSTAHVVVLPTFYGEGLPKILLEASACARPIVATAIPGCTEIVRDGENGFLIPPKDPDALAKAIRVLLENPILRKRMGRQGREIVVREYSVELVGRQTLAVYQALLEQSRQA